MSQVAKPEFKIIRLDEEEAYVTTEDLAKFSKNDVKSVKRLLNKYEEKLMEFSDTVYIVSKTDANTEVISNHSLKGSLQFPKNVGGETDFKKLKLNEHQTMFALMTMNNSDEVIEFKRKVTTDFFKLKAYNKALTKELETLNSNVTKALDNKVKENDVKDKTIQSLMSVDRNYLQLNENSTIYQSAEAMASKESYIAKDFRSFVQDLGLVKKESKITYYWRLTSLGEKSHLVLAHAKSTPYYSMELKTLFEDHIKNLQEEVKEKKERDERLAHLNEQED